MQHDLEGERFNKQIKKKSYASCSGASKHSPNLAGPLNSTAFDRSMPPTVPLVGRITSPAFSVGKLTVPITLYCPVVVTMSPMGRSSREGVSRLVTSRLVR